MQTIDLQRRIEKLAKVAPGVLERLGVRGSSLLDIEDWRQAMGGVFGHRTGIKYEARPKFGRPRILWEPTSDWAFDHNIVTNQGLDNILSVYFVGGSQVGAAFWVTMASKTNTTPLATHTYAAPGFTEITGSDVSETVREAWTGNAVSTQSTDNSGASVATYTAAGALTLYGAAMAGAPSPATGLTTFGNTAATGGILYSSALFASSIVLTASSTVDITYTQNAADDGV